MKVAKQYAYDVLQGSFLCMENHKVGDNGTSFITKAAADK